MKRYSLITNVPIQSGSLNRAVALVAAKGANINRIHYDRHIDPQTVFWEITCDCNTFEQICSSLETLGYLRRELAPVSLVKLTLHLPHEPGALNDFLRHTTESNAVITALAFDDEGSAPDTVTITVALDENEKATGLITTLSRIYLLEKIQMDGLEDISFYVQFIQKLDRYVPSADLSTTADLVVSINRVAQDLMRLGENPKLVFQKVLEGAQTIADTCGAGFYADIQTHRLSDIVTLHCIQPPCGGNVYLFETPADYLLLDTGYGVYYPDLMRLFSALGFDIAKKLTGIVLSHGDADHSGGAGLYRVPVLMHRAALETLRTENRAWGSHREAMILETVYSKMIGLISQCNPPSEQHIRYIEHKKNRRRGVFPVMDDLDIGDLSFEILESLGGHQVGEVVLFCPAKGFLFTADSLLHLEALSAARTQYNRVADFLMTSVNVNSDIARKERRGLMEIAADYYRAAGNPCLIFGGHGPICVEKEGRLHAVEPQPIRYTHGDPTAADGKATGKKEPAPTVRRPRP